jgi:hypothetical protein
MRAEALRRITENADRNSLRMAPQADDNDSPEDDPLAASIFDIVGCGFRSVAREQHKRGEI